MGRRLPIGKAVAKSISIPAPIGGLNARDSLAMMPETDAVTLDNWFPGTTTVALRNGYSKWATSLPAHVESLLPYTSATAAKLFAASGTAFYDVTSSGAVGAAVITGRTNARWQSVNMGTPGGQFLLAVNGSDKLQGYDGAAWWRDGDGTHDITGIDTSTCIHINTFKTRVYLVQKNTFIVWYLGANAISGAATSLDLSPIFKLGGSLTAMATWTVDNAAGIQEYAVFISSEGEVAVYQGYDPSTVGSFAQVAQFRIGRPVGRRCFVKVGSDSILITSDGFVPLSKAMLTDRSQENIAISNKIVNLVNNDIGNYGTLFGWEATLFPLGNKLIINVPTTENSVQRQYVMNTITGSWCRFTNWNANCFAVLQNTLYWGSNLGSAINSAFVAKADLGYSDNGAYIFGEAKPAFNYFGSPGNIKRWTMARPIFQVAGTINPSLGLDVDFADVFPTGTGSFSNSAGTAWNVGAWNTFPWGSVSAIQKDWQGVSGIGYCATIHMRLVNNVTPVQWMTTDYVVEQGGIL